MALTEINKFLVPPVPTDYLVRKDILRKLNNRDDKIIYLSAGPGYGKTTNLAFFSVINAHSAWYSVDAMDNDLIKFIKNCVLAVSGVIYDIDFHDLKQKIKDVNDNHIFTLTNEFLKIVGTSKHEVTLIIDDFQNITNKDIWKSGNHVIENSPPNFRLILSDRRNVPKEFIREKLNGRIKVISQDEFRLTRDELTAFMGFFNEKMYQESQGWISILKSIKIHSRSIDADTAGDTLNDFWLHDNIFALEGINSKLLTFLTKISFLDTLDVPLCNVIGNRNDSSEVFEKMLENNYFITKISADVYEYHTLLKNYLMSRNKDQEHEVLKTSVEFLVSQNAFDKAAEYACRINDYDSLQLCIKEIGEDLLTHGLYMSLEQYLEKFIQTPEICSPYTEYIIGLLLIYKKSCKAGITHLNIASDAFAKTDKLYYVKAQSRIAIAYKYMAAFDKSLETLDGISDALEILSDREQYEIISLKVFNYFWLYKYEMASDVVLSMISKYRSLAREDIALWYERLMLIVCFYKCDVRTMFEMTKKIHTISPSDMEFLKQISGAPYIAWAYLISGEFDESMHILEDSVNYQKRLGNMEQVWVNLYFSINLLSSGLFCERKEISNAELNSKILSVGTTLQKLTVWDNKGGFLNIVTDVMECYKLINDFSRPVTLAEFNEKLKKLSKNIVFIYQIAIHRVAQFLLYVDRPQDALEIYKTHVGDPNIVYMELPIYMKVDILEIAVHTDCLLGLAQRIKSFLLECKSQKLFGLLEKRKVYGSVLEFAYAHDIERKFLLTINSDPQKVQQVSIDVFGDVNIYFNGSDVPSKWRTGKTKELFVYLVTKGSDGVSKQEIIQALWQSRVSKKTSDIFSTTMYYLRSELKIRNFDSLITYNNGVYNTDKKCISINISDFYKAIIKYNETGNDTDAVYILKSYKGGCLKSIDSKWAREISEDVKEGVSCIIRQLKRNADSEMQIVVDKFIDANPEFLELQKL